MHERLMTSLCCSVGVFVICLTFSCGHFVFNQLKEQTETNNQRIKKRNSLYLCSVLMPRNINVGGVCLKTDMGGHKGQTEQPRPPSSPKHREFTASASQKSQKVKENEKQRHHKKLCTTNGAVNKTSVCVFVAKRLLNNLYLIPFCTT